MPPKTKFSRDEIVEAAFEIAREEGFSGITARSVAKQLGSSVAPIYVNFATIDDLVKAVVIKVHAISSEILASQTGTSFFANIGKASIDFAQQYPIIFRELSIQPNPHRASYEAIEMSMLEAMGQDEDLQGWTLEERKRLFLKMRIFQTGLATMVANDHIPSWMEPDNFADLLMEMGADLVKIQQAKREEKNND